MSVWKLSPALAAGCAVVLKPDPQTPLSVLRIAELATEVGFPAGAINIVPADGPTTGSYLVKHPGVDKVAFTGSTRTGSEIMRLCSDPIKRLTLELGGKSPDARLRRREPRRRDPELGLVDLLRGRPELRGALARARRGLDLRRLRGALRRGGEAAQGRRPARRRDAGRLAHLDRAPRPRARLRREGPRGGRGGRARRRGRRRRGRVLPPDRARRRRELDDGRAGGDLRPGRDGDPVRGREGRDPDRERRPATACSPRSGRATRRAGTASRARSSPGWSASTCRSPRSRASRSAATSSRASAASSRSTRSTSTSRRRASSSPRARSPSTRSGSERHRADGRLLPGGRVRPHEQLRGHRRRPAQARPPGRVHRGGVVRRHARGEGLRGADDAAGRAAGGARGAGPVLEGLHPRHGARLPQEHLRAARRVHRADLAGARGRRALRRRPAGRDLRRRSRRTSSSRTTSSASPRSRRAAGRGCGSSRAIRSR